MKLNVQIYSFLFSFLFGCGFYFLLDVFNRIVDRLNMILKVLISFVFIMMVGIVYFIMLLYINNGVVHVYFLLMILVGYIFVYKILFKLFTHLKKK